MTLVIPGALAPPPVVRAPAILRATLWSTLALAPLEGYLHAVNDNLGKLPPALFLIVWALHRLAGNRPLGVSHPVVWCSLGMLALVFSSTAVNLDNGHALLYMTRWVPFLVLVVALADVFAKDVDPWFGIHALVVGAACSGLGAIISFGFLGSPRATGPLEDPNDLAYVLTAAVPLVILAVRRAQRHAGAIAWALVLALLLVGAAATFSRGGILASTAVVVWALSRRLVPVRLLLAAAGLLAVLAVPLVVVAQDVVEQALAEKQYIAAANVDTRLLRWQAAARMLADNPLLGLGPGGFQSHYVEYSGFAELAERSPVAHEMYLEVGAELGAPALLLFVGAIGAAVVGTEDAIRRRRVATHAEAGHADDVLVSAALAIQGSLLAICISSVFLSEQYYLPLWASLALAAAIDHRAREAEA